MVLLLFTGDMDVWDALDGEGTREMADVLAGVDVPEKTSAGGRHPYGLIRSLIGTTNPFSSDAGDEGIVADSDVG